MMIRPSAAANARSAWADRRHHDLLSSAEPAIADRRASSMVPAARRISSAVMRLSLARQFVAAARPADALEDSLVHQRLQHRFEMPRRQTVPAASALADTGRSRRGARRR